MPQAVAASLRQLGYAVTFRENTTLRDLVETLRDFSVRAARASVRLLFYAGPRHPGQGPQLPLPVDTEPQSEDEIGAKTADVGEFIDRLSALKHGAQHRRARRLPREPVRWRRHRRARRPAAEVPRV